MDEKQRKLLETENTVRENHTFGKLEAAICAAIQRGTKSAVEVQIDANERMKWVANTLNDLTNAVNALTAVTVGGAPVAEKRAALALKQEPDKKNTFVANRLEDLLKKYDLWDCKEQHCGFCGKTPEKSEEMELLCWETRLNDILEAKKAKTEEAKPKKAKKKFRISKKKTK